MNEMIPGIRPTIRDVHPYVAGKTTEQVRRELGLSSVVKLGSNENPYAPFPTALEAMQAALATIHTYPENSFVELRRRIGSLYDLSGDHVAIAHGAGGMLETIARAFVQPGDEVVTLSPTYGLYREISRFMGAEIVTVPVAEDHATRMEDLVAAVTPATKIVWLCNPNNPTGTVTRPADLTPLLDALPPHGWVVVDEAYAEFADAEVLPDSVSAVRSGRHVIVVRTFSKAYGLAGARMGYALADPATITAIDTVAEPFNANRVGIAGATATLDGGLAEVRAAVEKIRNGRARLEAALAELGMEVVSTHTNFVFFALPDGHQADAVADALLHRGVIVRSAAGWGYPRHMRVTVGTEEENETFLRAFREVLDG